MKRTARFNDHKTPLVSVILQSHNEGEFLGECLDSILNQTFDNIEICLYDCAAGDNTWKVGSEYQKKYSGIISLINLRKDYHPERLIFSMLNIRGKYFMSFDACSYIAPDLVEKCVSVLECNPDAAFAMVNRVKLNKDGIEVPAVPMYLESCIIPGEKHIPNLFRNIPPANVSFSMFKTDLLKCEGIRDHYSNEILLCLKYSMIYIKEPLFYYREPEQVNLPGVDNMLAGMYSRIMSKLSMLQNLFMVNDMHNIVDVLPETFYSLSKLCLQQSIEMLIEENENAAKKLFHLAAVIDLRIEDDLNFNSLKKYWGADKFGKLDIINELKQEEISFDSAPYALPEGTRLLQP